MYRKFVLRGQVIEGVFQRCHQSCPASACKAGHKWEYRIELPAVDDGRRQVKKGGFATGKAAADARAEILNRHRKGMQPKNHKLTVGEWLVNWLRVQEEVRGLGDGTMIDYRRHVEKYWIPAIGTIRLGELRPSDVTNTLAEIRNRRERLREQAQAQNRQATVEAAARDKTRIEKGLKRPVKPKLVRVPRPIGQPPRNAFMPPFGRPSAPRSALRRSAATSRRKQRSRRSVVRR
ncbi:hypothetical protein Rhe02_81150 [Rhizocola hellebori]|uniref:Core-binding (CB) domain-containing protein n=1 Tax=Rhizocola hellebori TaxID=1392758 RepID=A0A8J3VLD9_9ACTN|nr:hypothetical protein [Rhizocola hellebori]GIH10048.1 hypothetical protein Rhe02_81150 [Rhizocola hellebori]